MTRGMLRTLTVCLALAIAANLAAIWMQVEAGGWAWGGNAVAAIVCAFALWFVHNRDRWLGD